MILVGLYGAFRLRIKGESWRWCRSAVIPSGLEHALDFGGDPIAALYLEPDAGGVAALAPLVDNRGSEAGALVGYCAEAGFLREAFEKPPPQPELDYGLRALLLDARLRSEFEGLDPRVRNIARSMMAGGSHLEPIAQVAKSVGLSSSRFQHIFSREVGVPYRRYRSWGRMRMAITEIANGRSLTAAAHAAGYADLPHFTRDCRRTFGGVFTRRDRERNS